jgi:multiple antibiotic resistance protein
MMDQDPTEALRQTLTPGRTFIYLFLTLGPLKIIGPFIAMTRGHEASFKRTVALEGTVIAAIAMAIAGTAGAVVLKNWNVSLGALMLTAGVVLFLVALRPVLAQYEPHPPPPAPAAPLSEAVKLAFSPLAFPTIVTPYGIAVLILLVTLADGDVDRISSVIGIAAAVMVINLAVMLLAELLLEAPLARLGLGILGAVMAVFQIALGVQAIIGGLRLLGVLPVAGA